MRPAALAALVAGSVVLLATLGLVLTDSKPRQSGSNYVAELEPVAEIARTGKRCQSDVLVPGDTDRVRVLLGTYGRPAPELLVSARVEGRRLTSGRLAGGGPEGHVEVPLEPVKNTTPGARVCVRLRGRGPTVLYGSSGLVRLEWLRPGSETWLQLLPTVARRFGFGKANALGAWLLAVVALLLVLTWVATIRLVARELRG